VKKSLNLIIGFLAICWISYLLSLWFPIQQYGIVPRQSVGLIGIVAAPFLHGSFTHLSGNSVSFAILMLILSALEERQQFFKLFLMALLTGILTWLMARNAVHIGASGLIFAIFGYLVLSGWFARRVRYVLVALLVIFLYGGMIYGVLPGKVGISWESHLFGFISGGFLSWYFHAKQRKGKRKAWL